MDAFRAQEGKGISCFEAEGKKSETRAAKKKVCKIQLEASGQVLREGSEGWARKRRSRAAKESANTKKVAAAFENSSDY